MAPASTFHNAAGPDDASWKGFMLHSGSPEPPPAPRGPPLRYYLTTSGSPEPPPVPRGPPLRYYLTTVSADRSSNLSDGVKLNGPLTTARLREASSTANQAAQGVYVFTSLAEAQDETDLGFDAAYPAACEFCRKCGKSTTVDGLPVVGEEALVSAVTEAKYDRMNGHGHHMKLPTGYSVGPSDPKAWPFLTAFDDPKVYAMRELHALSESYDSIDSWDAVKCGPYEKKYFMQRRAGREATMEARGEAFNIGEGG
eukprot:jgi/Tetstr1/421042/TSEL_012087.t1